MTSLGEWEPLMEMKLSGSRIKELRLKVSWSQEKLAEEAGLNARTVQRVETDGSASLRTRLQIAEALRVRPEDLDADAGARVNVNTGATGMSIYYLTVLILVSVIYLAAQPAYFSLSVVNFSWINYGFGRPWHEIGAWWVANLSVWALVSLPVLFHLYKKHRALFLPYLGAFSTGLGLSVLRLWEADRVAEVLSTLLSISGLALLLSLYIPRLNTSMLRHGVYMCLSAYLFLWFFHDLVYFLATAYEWSQRFDDFPWAWVPRDYVMGSLARDLGDLVQVIPLVLVLILSLGHRPAWSRPSAASGRTPDLPLTSV